MKKVNIIFIAAAVILLGFLISSIVYNPGYVKDCVFAFLALAAFYLLERKYDIGPWFVVLGIIPLLLHLSGLTFGFFAYSFWGIGYDKFLHFTSSAVVTLLIYLWLMKYSHQNKVLKILMAMLIVLGFGSLNEIIEFVGQQYFHVYGPTMFSQGDSLPPSLKNDLIKFDTWWDMIFNLFGTVFGAIACLLYKPRHGKDRFTS